MYSSQEAVMNGQRWYAMVLVGAVLCLAGLTAPASAANIAAGAYHSLALKADGSVVAWGKNNWYGQCNVPASARSGVIAVAGGSLYSLALKSDGNVVAWGDIPWKTLVPALMLLLGN